jgi:hypothetical protein
MALGDTTGQVEGGKQIISRHILYIRENRSHRPRPCHIMHADQQDGKFEHKQNRSLYYKRPVIASAHACLSNQPLLQQSLHLHLSLDYLVSSLSLPVSPSYPSSTCAKQNSRLAHNNTVQNRQSVRLPRRRRKGRRIRRKEKMEE